MAGGKVVRDDAWERADEIKMPVGKMADVVLWNGDPLDIRNRVLRTFVSGDEVYSWDPDTRQATWASRY